MFAPRDPDDYLLDTERRVIRIRRHWAVLLWDTFQAAASLAICVLVSYLLPPALWVVQNVLWYAALLVVLHFAYKVMAGWVGWGVARAKRFAIATGGFDPP